MTDQKNKLVAEAILKRIADRDGFEILKSQSPLVVRILCTSSSTASMATTTTTDGTGKSEAKTEHEHSLSTVVKQQDTQPALVTVYCDTGTIGITRFDGRDVRSVFRRKVNSTETVIRILEQPPHLTVIERNAIANEEDENDPKHELDLADLGLTILNAEKERLLKHLRALDEATEGKAAKESVLGEEFQFGLPEDVLKHVDECLFEIQNMNKRVKCLAINGKAAVFLYGSGGLAFTPNLPRQLHQKLVQLRAGNQLQRPAYISLGHKDRFFIRFNDGTYALKGPKSLEKAIRAQEEPPISVAFGSNYDAVACINKDGTFFHSGKQIPKGLLQKVEGRDDLLSVSLGPAGEWSLRTTSGRIWWGNISDELDEELADLLRDGRSPRFTDFGEGDSFFISYD